MGRARARFRPAIADVLLFVGGLAAVLLTLVAFDDRVRGQFAGIGRGHPPSGLAAAGVHISIFAGVLLEAARDQGIEHAPLVVFSVAAVVLVLFMIRL